MKRGDLVTVALQGDFGKPRPALVVQSDLFNAHSSVTVLPITSTLIDAPLLRITVQATAINGLQTVSQIMLDKAMTVKSDNLSAPFGAASNEIMVQVSRGLALFWALFRQLWSDSMITLLLPSVGQYVVINKIITQTV
jgi:mRNA interferase MazF